MPLAEEWKVTHRTGRATMLRFSVVLLLLGSSATGALAWPLTYGIRAGSSGPNLRDNGGNELSSGWSSRVAPYFGVFVEAELTPAFSLETSIAYASQGGQRNGLQPISADLSSMGVPPGTPLFANYDNVAKLDYLEVPVLARHRFGVARRLYADLGPFIGFLLSATTETSGESPVCLDAQGTMPVTGAQNFDATTDVKSSLNTINWGVQGGVGYGQPVGRGVLSLDMRAGLGLTNIQKDPDQDGKNSTGNLVFALAYSMRFGNEDAR